MRYTLDTEQCLRDDIYEDIYGGQVRKWFDTFLDSYKLVMEIFRAIRVRDRVIESLFEMKFTDNCNASLFRMTYCARCRGHPVDYPYLPCRDLCLNTMRGCMVDTLYLVDSMDALTKAIRKLRQKLEINDVKTALFSSFFAMINDTSSQSTKERVLDDVSFYISEVLIPCGIESSYQLVSYWESVCRHIII